MHKKSGGGLSAKGSTDVGRSKEKGVERSEGEGDANDVMIEIKRIKNVEFLNFAGFPLLFARFGSQKDAQ